MALGIPAEDSSENQSKPITPSAPPLKSLISVDTNATQFVVALDVSTTALRASERLRRIINEKINCDIISDVTEAEFRQMIEFLEVKKLQFKDQNHRLQMFNVAKRYNCADMQIYCLREVDANLDVSNVITVYRTLCFNGSITSHKDSIDRKQTNFKKFNYTPEEFLTYLVFNVLQFINMNADNVLLSEGIDGLRFKEFKNIVSQDDLLLRSELVLIDTLTRWSRAKCRRKNIELTLENERSVLRELCYAPRYLMLSSSEFELASNNIRFLDLVELKLIREAFDDKNSGSTVEQTNMLNNFRKPRPKYTHMPIYLSPRSHPKNYSRQMRRNDRNDSDGSSCFLDCLAAFIFLCD
ncbi:uncharacterized protein LOC116337643 [Contarinia nasturtii]|uniref:uncharacterized protein LOC116337643 n=1 Tax=Contarinia nasturtii TaxID=265458 RepID=UPI0012D3B823|nr:uncharacterized protein LOC116337643 [Contarinia nasturtii]